MDGVFGKAWHYLRSGLRGALACAGGWPGHSRIPALLRDAAWPFAARRERLHAKLKEQHGLLARQDQKLRERNLQFDMAINNMSQGLCFFNGEQRLIVCNRRYVEMYGLDADEIVPGISLREIIDLRFEIGSFPAMSRDEYHAWRNTVAVSDTPSDTVVELRNGRVFEIHHRPMPDGGWVATHTDITDQRLIEARLAHMALHDPLTGLANRVLLNERLEQAFARVKRGESMAVHLLDLDHFKPVNDTLGHPAGDKVLKMVAERLRGVVRDIDTVARMGGDEFAIVQVGIAEPFDATSLARRVIDEMSRPFSIESRQVTIGTSVGIAVGPRDGLSPDELFRNADLALYRAKAEGRGTHCSFEYMQAKAPRTEGREQRDAAVAERRARH